MSYAAVKKLDGFVAVGGEVPSIDPNAIKIVGIDTPETPENWFAHCGRVNDIPEGEITAYAEAIVAAGKVDHIVKVYRDGDALVALDGRTTTRAAREAREIQAKRKVPVDERVSVRVNILRGDEEELYRVNLDSHKHRPLTRTQHAKGILTYYQKVSEDAQKTANFFKVSVPTIKTMLAHLDLSVKVQRAIDQKDVPATITNQLAKLPRAEQDAALEEMMAAGATRGAAAANAAGKVAKREKVDKADKTRARSKVFLAKWRDELKKEDDFSTIAQVIHFILGGPLPSFFKSNEAFAKTLEAAGFVEKGKKKKTNEDAS